MQQLMRLELYYSLEITIRNNRLLCTGKLHFSYHFRFSSEQQADLFGLCTAYFQLCPLLLHIDLLVHSFLE